MQKINDIKHEKYKQNLVLQAMTLKNVPTQIAECK